MTPAQIQEYSSIVKQLYEKDRFTAEKTKKILEEEHGFPHMSTVQFRKLLAQLNLRKKVEKGSHWAATVAIHLKARGAEATQDPKPTTVYRHGIALPWKTLWKEIRRATGGLDHNQGIHSLPRLPSGIEVRTPSPAMQHCVLRKAFNIVYAEMPVSKENRDSICAWGESNLLSLYADIYPVPWRQLEEVIYECREFRIRLGLDRGHDQQQVDPSAVDARELRLLRRAPRIPFLELMDPPIFQTALTQVPRLMTDYGRRLYMLQTIYQLSNKTFRLLGTRDYVRLLDVFLTTFDIDFMTTLFNLDTPTIRAAWESFIDIAWIAGNQEIFNYLVSPGNCQAGWINARRKRIDWQAALLSDSRISEPASLKPLESDTMIAKVFDYFLVPYIRRLRMSREYLSDDYATILLGRLVHYLHREETQCPDDCAHLIEYLIRSNADALITAEELHSLKEATCPQLCAGEGYSGWCFVPNNRYFGGTDEGVELTAIDLAYCIDPALYVVYEDNNPSLQRIPTFAGALSAFNQGVETFETYLQVNRFTDTDKQDQFLHNTLVHFAHLEKGWTPAHLQMLLLAGENADSLAGKILHLFVNLAALPAESPERTIIHNLGVKVLVETGCQISPKALLNASRPGSADLLSYLVGCSGLRELGPLSICASAWTGNTESLGLLERLGVAVSNVEIGIVSYPAHPGFSRCRHTFFGDELGESGRDERVWYYGRRVQYPLSLLQAVGKGSEEHLPPLAMLIRSLNLAKNGVSKAPQIYLYDLLLGCLESRADLRTTSEVCQLVKSEGLEFRDQPQRPPLIQAFLCALNDFKIPTCFNYPSSHAKERPGVLEAIFRFLVRNSTPLPKDVVPWLLELGASDDLILFALDSGAQTVIHGLESSDILSSMASHGRLSLLRSLLEQRRVEIDPVDLAMAFGTVNAMGNSEISPLERLETLKLMEQFSPDLKILPDEMVAGIATRNARLGDVDSIIILLRYGLDINSVRHYPLRKRYECRYETALDSASSSGYLDMVQLLLNSGGTSAYPGETGYDGAIANAEWWGHHAVAELIRKWADLGVQGANLGIEDLARL